MDDLSQSIYGFVEKIVEAMHIDENAPAMRQILFHPGLRLRHSGERVTLQWERWRRPASKR